MEIFKYFTQKEILNRFFSLKLQFSHLALSIKVKYEEVYTSKTGPNFIGSPFFHFKIYKRIL